MASVVWGRGNTIMEACDNFEVQRGVRWLRERVIRSNCVILITHSSYYYLMWDFTHTCIPNILGFKNDIPPIWACLGLMKFLILHKYELLLGRPIKQDMREMIWVMSLDLLIEYMAMR